MSHTFINLNTRTVVYFKTIKHTPSCCHKYSSTHQVSDKNSPQQMHIYSCVNDVC